MHTLRDQKFEQGASRWNRRAQKVEIIDQWETSQRVRGTDKLNAQVKNVKVKWDDGTWNSELGPQEEDRCIRTHFATGKRLYFI